MSSGRGDGTTFVAAGLFFVAACLSVVAARQQRAEAPGEPWKWLAILGLGAVMLTLMAVTLIVR